MESQEVNLEIKEQLFLENLFLKVEDTQKKLGDLFVHYGKVKTGEIKINDVVEMKIDVERRR